MLQVRLGIGFTPFRKVIRLLIIWSPQQQLLMAWIKPNYRSKRETPQTHQEPKTLSFVCPLSSPQTKVVLLTNLVPDKPRLKLASTTKCKLVYISHHRETAFVLRNKCLDPTSSNTLEEDLQTLLTNPQMASQCFTQRQKIKAAGCPPTFR